MDLQNYEKYFILKNLKINESYGKIFCFIDFANVNNWFEKDTQTWDNELISDDKKINIDLEKLKNFVYLFSEKAMIYYGEDLDNQKSLKFTYLIRKIFGKRRVVTKKLQKIRHYFKSEEGGECLEIRKCNFDVEISVDAIKMLNHYDTFCLFSGDVDFVYLNNFLKGKRKKIIIVKAGYITKELRASADLIVNAQNIKEKITRLKNKGLT